MVRRSSHTWWPHNEDRFNTPEFKEVLQRFVDDLRQTGLLKNLGPWTPTAGSMAWLHHRGPQELWLYCGKQKLPFLSRCTPLSGEYQGTLLL